MSNALSIQATEHQATSDTRQTISPDELNDITGGGRLGTAVKFVGKKVLGPVGAVYSGYQGVKGYLNARDQGKSVGESLVQGAKDFVF